MELAKRVQQAVQFFWSTRDRQAAQQGGESGKKDAGARAAVTGGAQMDGFVRLVRDILYDNGLRQAEIIHESRLELPGWYRAEKKWDLLVISDGNLIASIEFKSQIGPSFGNNFNNRAEEDFETAQLVFDDPHSITFVERVSDNEERWHAIGSIEKIIVIVVVHTYREEASDEVIRIISARRATRHERNLYAQANG